MIGALLATLAGSAWARTALRYGVTALAILLFLLALRRSGERAGRLAGGQNVGTQRSGRHGDVHGDSAAGDGRSRHHHSIPQS
jgi:membrane protein implicated in regulation of membrane protease activity